MVNLSKQKQKEIMKEIEEQIGNVFTMVKKGQRDYIDFLNDYLKCLDYGGDTECYKRIFNKYLRKFPLIKDSIYPWNNYDWDYAQFIDNHYSPIALGASPKGTFDALWKNIIALMKIGDAMIFAANPNSRSEAGNKHNSQSDVRNCGLLMRAALKNGANEISSYAKNGEFYNVTRATHRMTKKIKSFQTLCPFMKQLKHYFYQNQREPYPGFLRKYNIPKKALRGEGSSSYFIKVGYCQAKKPKTKNSCQQKGYAWWGSGGCWYPKYAFVDNKPGMNLMFMKFKGMIPSLAKDMLSLAPDKMMKVMMGQDISGFGVLPCIEEFQGHRQNNCKIRGLWLILFVSIIIYFLSQTKYW